MTGDEFRSEISRIHYILLYPSNGHPPIVRPKEDPELVYRGVVYWRGGNI